MANIIFFLKANGAALIGGVRWWYVW